MGNLQPVYEGVHLFVRDMARTVAFYRILGLPIAEGAEQNDHVVVPGMAIVFGSHELTRGYDPNFEEPRGASPNSLQFQLATRLAVDEMYAQLTSAGFAEHLPPIDAFWGSRYAVVCDPDGNLVGLQSPRDSARAAPPPLSMPAEGG